MTKATPNPPTDLERFHRIALNVLHFGLCFAMAALVYGYNFTDFDLWGVLATGALIIENGEFPYHDVFSYTAPGAPWIYHEWGSGVLLYWLLKQFGSKIIMLLGILLFASPLAFAVEAYKQAIAKIPTVAARIQSHLLWLITTLAFLFMSIPYRGAFRCHLFSFFFYALFLWVLQSRYQNRWTWPLMVLPVAMLLWVNLHGGFILGFVLLGVYGIAALYERRFAEARQLGLVLTLCLVATFCNPYGVNLLLELASAWGQSRSNVTEWNSIWENAPVYFGIVCIAVMNFWILLAAFNTLKPDGHHRTRHFPVIAVLLLLTAWQGFAHYKLLMFFNITFLILGCDLALPRIRLLDHPLALKLANTLFVCLCFIVTAFSLYACYPGGTMRYGQHIQAQGMDSETSVNPYPFGAFKYFTQTQAHGNLWLPFVWGEAALWHLYPNILVSMDGRYETVYPESAMQDNMVFFTAPYDISVLKKYPNTDFLLIPKAEKALVEKLSMVPEWHLVYEDKLTQVFSKSPAAKNIVGYDNRTRLLDVTVGDLSRFKIKAPPP